MQQWEYCVITCANTSRRLYETSGTKFQIFTGDMTTQDIPSEGLASLIAQLGKDGWEMVGAGNAGEDTHNLYFKRPEQ